MLVCQAGGIGNDESLIWNEVLKSPPKFDE
jgi:hypothetical protein